MQPQARYAVGPPQHQPLLPEAMQMLNALPESVKGCLLEAARLCGPSAACPAQENVLQSWAAQVVQLLLLPLTLTAVPSVGLHYQRARFSQWFIMSTALCAWGAGNFKSLHITAQNLH